ncbi:YARHG domain-containing protein [Fulvivirga sp.]|uniref:YARHG domain-containing protein n=1 Tax=Fulvivirga sp. TaxID=1931237 RepID=UPI0032EACB49
MRLSSSTPYIVYFLVLCSCGQGNKQETQSEILKEDSTKVKKEVLRAALQNDPRKIGPEKSKEQYQIEEDIYKINAADNPLYGYWVGDFGKNKINIALAYANNDSIYGHSVCAGNFRPIKGLLEEVEEGKYSIVMREPGDDKYDGEFQFEIDINKGELVGTWSPYKNTVSSKQYRLMRRVFRYEPSNGDFPMASTQYLDVPDVENFLPEEIELIRNEIYARHGYSFQNLKIRRIFDAKDWYIPMAIDIRDQLTELEAHNIDLLYNYEEYYAEYYDEYGR